MKKRVLSVMLAMSLAFAPIVGAEAEESLIVEESALEETPEVYSGEAEQASQNQIWEEAAAKEPGEVIEEAGAAESGEAVEETAAAESGEAVEETAVSESGEALEEGAAEESGEVLTEGATEESGEILEETGAEELQDLPGDTESESFETESEELISADELLLNADAGDFLIEEIEEVEETEGISDDAEVLTEEITGSLHQNILASDAMLRKNGRYSAGAFPGSFGGQLSGLAKTAYTMMKNAYVTQRSSADLKIPVSFKFQTTGTISGGQLVWNRDSNADYQEMLLAIEYALQSAFDALVYDYPEVFWMGASDYSFVIQYRSDEDGFTGTVSSVNFSPVEAYSGAKAEIAAFDAAVKSTAASISTGSRLTTVKNIHDYLCKKIIYQENAYAHSAGGVFLHQRSDGTGSYSYVVCEGYAKAFKILCNYYDINCILVVGYAGDAHMWNYVQMEDNNWYLVDVTWDDGDSSICYDYFLKGSNSPSLEYEGQDIGTERLLYTNFSMSEYTQNFNYPILSDTEYSSGTHNHVWQVTAEQKPTCTEAGFYVYQCSCGAISYEILDALGHSFKNQNYVYNNDATCLSDGTKTAVCDNGCGTTRQTVRAEGTKLKPTISFNASSLKLKKKQSTTKFKVTFGKGDYVKSWKSSNTKIVKVSGKSDGTCTIKAQNKTGSAKIKVTLASGKTKTLKVKVQKTAVKTTKISGVPKTLSMTKGSKKALSVTISPFTSKQKVTYSSSKKKVATVSAKGVISAKKKGTATITVKSGTKKVKCKVKVK